MSSTGLEVWMRRSALNAPMNFQRQFSLDGFASPGTPIRVVGTMWTQLGVRNTLFYTWDAPVEWIPAVSQCKSGSSKMFGDPQTPRPRLAVRFR